MHENNSLFVYGTLLFEQIWQIIVGRNPDLQVANVIGWQRYYLKNKLYPGLVGKPGNLVEGALIRQLSDDDWRKLDAFEDTIYSKQKINIIIANREKIVATAYVIEDKQRACLSNKVWSPDAFEKEHLQSFIQLLEKR